MFIINTKADESVKDILNMIKEKFGNIPPQFELLASINPKRFKIFIQEIIYLAEQKNINKDFFIFIRVYIASKENFIYCKKFNTKLLLAKGFSMRQIKDIKDDISNILLDDKHKQLAQKAIKAVYDYENFNEEDIEYLHSIGWNNEAIFDSIDHASFLFKNARIIRAYLKKS